MNQRGLFVIPLGSDGEPGTPSDWDGSPGQWLVASASSIQGFTGENIALDTTAWDHLLQHEDHFQLHQAGADLYVQFVPEPTTLAMLLLALPACCRRRLR